MRATTLTLRDADVRRTKLTLLPFHRPPLPVMTTTDVSLLLNGHKRFPRQALDPSWHTTYPVLHPWTAHVSEFTKAQDDE